MYHTAKLGTVGDSPRGYPMIEIPVSTRIWISTRKSYLLSSDVRSETSDISWNITKGRQKMFPSQSQHRIGSLYFRRPSLLQTVTTLMVPRLTDCACHWPPDIQLKSRAQYLSNSHWWLTNVSANSSSTIAISVLFCNHRVKKQTGTKYLLACLSISFKT